MEWREHLDNGWYEALEAIHNYCDLQQPQFYDDSCTFFPQQAQRIRETAIKTAYTELMQQYPIRVRLEVLDPGALATLTGLETPREIDSYVMVVAFRLSLPHLPGGLKWEVTDFNNLLGVFGDSAGRPAYFDHDPEGFVVALGGQMRPSTKAAWRKKKHSLPTTIADYRRLENMVPITQWERYGVSPPTGHGDGDSPLTSAAKTVGLSVMAIPLAISGLIGGSIRGPDKDHQTAYVEDLEYRSWLRKLTALEQKDCLEWAQTQREASLLKLWHGQWHSSSGSASSDEVLLTHGYELFANFEEPNRDPLSQEESEKTVWITLRPVSGETQFSPVSIVLRTFRRGDLRQDLMRASKSGWRTVSKDSLAF